jgi:hypothetical protein
MRCALRCATGVGWSPTGKWPSNDCTISSTRYVRGCLRRPVTVGRCRWLRLRDWRCWRVRRRSAVDHRGCGR